MKKTILVLFIVLLFVLSYAQEPKSMRKIASGGLFTDSWDDIFNSISLCNYDSTYFFTNISDYNIEFRNHNDQIYEESKNRVMEELPLGISFSNPYNKNLKHALFIRFSNTLNPGYKQDTEEESISYIDYNEDGIYDNKVVSHIKNMNNDEDKSKLDLIWNNNYQFENFILGIKLSSFVKREEMDDASGYISMANFDPMGYISSIFPGDNSFEEHWAYHDLVNDEDEYVYNQTGDFKTSMKDDQKKLQVAFQFDFSRFLSESKLRFYLGYDTHNDLSCETDDSFNANYQDYYYDSVSETELIDEGEVSYHNHSIIETNQTEPYLYFRLRKNWQPDNVVKKAFCEISLRTGFVKGDIKKNEKEVYSSHIYEDGLDEDERYTSSEEYKMISSEEGDLSGIHLNTHFRLNLPLNQSALFGFGCYLDYSNIISQLDYKYEFNRLYNYQSGDQYNDENDYTETETDMHRADRETVTDQYCLQVPVALEFQLPKEHLSNDDAFSLRNFVFRIASNFIYNSHNLEYTDNDIENNPNFVITEYGDGSVTEEHGENFMEAEKDISTTMESRKQFSAGIGYRHSDNVSIDVAAVYDYNNDEYYIGVGFTINQ